MAERKTGRILCGGPYDKQTIFLTASANTTVTFRVGDFYGRYILSDGNSHMEWKERYKELHELVISGPIHRSRTNRVIKAILEEAA